MLIMTFEAIAPMADAQGVKEWLAMILEECGCRDVRCTDVREDIEQLRLEARK